MDLIVREFEELKHERNMLEREYSDLILKLKNGEKGNLWFFDEIDNIPKDGFSPYRGYVYAIEYGSMLKIGQSRNLRQRLRTLKSHAKNYSGAPSGKFVFSLPHTNHLENEKILHEYFKSKRTNGELFNISIQDFIDSQPILDFKDKSEEKEKRSNVFAGFMKDFVLNSYSAPIAAGHV